MPQGPSTTLNGVRFTAREWTISELISQNLSNKEIAFRLHLGEPTIKVYLSRIFDKMRAARPELAGQSFRLVLAGWLRCHKCGVFHDPGSGI